MNKKSVSRLYWYASFHCYSEEEQIETFQHVIESKDDWLETDTIIAYPDSDGYCIQYSDGVISRIPYEMSPGKTSNLQAVVCKTRDY